MRARHVDFIAIAVEQRHGRAPGGTVGTVGLAAQAGAQQGVVGDIGFEDAVEHLLLLGQVVHEGLAVLIGGDEAAAHVALRGQRAADVEFAAVGVPAAGAGGDVAGKLPGRALAHQVHGRGRAAEAAEQAGGALEDFHAVVDDHVGLVDAIAEAERRRNAIDLEVVDLETAGLEAGATAVELVDGDAGRLRQDVADAGQVLVIHLLAGDDADRLRSLARRQRQLGGGTRRAGGVGTGALGSLAEAVVGDGRGHQLYSSIAVLLLLG
ncbi:hypothetical protein D9M70_408210 [compost metagenome]